MAEVRTDDHTRAQRSYFEAREKRRMVPTGSPYVRRHVDELVRFGGLQPGARVLEVGCGMGRYTLLLADQGFRVEGFDLSPVLLERLRSFDGGRFDIPLHEGDVADPPATLGGVFDAVIGFVTLHHLHDLGSCFAAMAQLARPGGCVVFLEPNPLNPLYYVQITVAPGMSWDGDGGIVRMRPQIVFAAMHEVGLEQLTLRRFGFFPPFAANSGWGRRLEPHLERIRPLRSLLPFQLFRGVRPG